MAKPELSFQLDASRKYPFVDSTEEHARLNEQSAALNEAMLGQFSLAPLHKPQKILDVGCGTAIITRLFAEKYPEATVIGCDPNPVPNADSKPSNVEFVLGSIEDVVKGKHELFQPASFDLIYSRWLIMAIQDWKAHIKLLLPLLKPQGWLELQEVHLATSYDEHEHVVSDNWQFPRIFHREREKYGLDWEIAAKLPSLCRELGCVDVDDKTFPMPFRPGWKARPETERLGAYMEKGMPPFFRTILPRSVRPEEGEDAEAIVNEALENLPQGPVGRHATFHAMTARKPAD